MFLYDSDTVISTGTPRHINYESVLRDLNGVEGVKLAHNLHIWSLTMSKTAAAAHLALGKPGSTWVCHVLGQLYISRLTLHSSNSDPGANTQDVLDRASLLLQNRHDIHHTTLQVENYQEAMENCRTCQRRPKGSPPRAVKNQASSEFNA